MFWRKRKKDIIVDETGKNLKSGEVSRVVGISGSTYDLPFKVYVDLTDKDDRDVLNYILLLEMQELKKYIEKTDNQINSLKHKLSISLKKNARLRIAINRLINKSQNN